MERRGPDAVTNFGNNAPGVKQEAAAVSALKRSGGSGSSLLAQDKKEEGWRLTGNPLIGQEVVRIYGGKLIRGRVSGWLPAKKATASAEHEPALFHVTHEDGDEEDLDVSPRAPVHQFATAKAHA